MYVTLNYQLISWIEQEKEIELKLEEAVFISLVDSFRRQNQKCEMSKSALQQICMCSRTSIGNIIRNLKKYNIIKVWYPPNQSVSNAPCTFWLHDDIIAIIKDLQAVSKHDIGPVSRAVSPDDTNIKRIGDSSSFGDSSSQHTEQNWLNSFSL